MTTTLDEADWVKKLEDSAKWIADLNGRPWSDMGEYERETYRDEARLQIEAAKNKN